MEKLGLRRLGLLRIFPSEAGLGSPGPPASSSGNPGIRRVPRGQDPGPTARADPSCSRASIAATAARAPPPPSWARVAASSARAVPARHPEPDHARPRGRTVPGPGSRSGGGRPPSRGPRRIAPSFPARSLRRRSRLAGRVAAASPSAQNLPGERAARSFPRRRPRHPRAGEAREAARPQPGAAQEQRLLGERGWRPQGQADPHWSGSPPGSAAGRKEGGNREGGGEEAGGGGGRRGGGRAGGPPPALINHPADQMSLRCTREAMDRPTNEPGSASLTCAAEPGSRLPAAPLVWKSAQSLQLPPGAAARTRSSDIRMARGPDRRRGDTETSGWKLWTSESGQLSELAPSGTAAPLTSERPGLAARG
nr:unnamed protein product [Rangifer tarandus platyrhynchus]